jgi:glutathione synthase
MTQPIVALQMDPLCQIKVETDTTFALGLEAQNQGYKLFAYTPDCLSYAEGKIMARGSWVTFKDQVGDFYVLEGEALLNLVEARFVLMRQDPPFHMAYIAATHLLDLLPSTTRVINNPTGVRNSPEKLLVTHFPDLMPPTLLSSDPSLIADFIRAQGAVILKPIFDFGGNGILSLAVGDPNITGILEMHQKLYGTPPIFQKFLKEVDQGDKRIILLDGKPAGIFKRIPPKGDVRSNMRVGGQAQACDFSSRDLEICARIGPTLKERGLYLAGIDVIGDYLTEINVTSPTGLRTLKHLYQLDLAKDFWKGIL